MIRVPKCFQGVVNSTDLGTAMEGKAKEEGKKDKARSFQLANVFLEHCNDK